MVVLEGSVEANGSKGHRYEMQQQVHHLLGRPRPEHDPVRHDRFSSADDEANHHEQRVCRVDE